VLKISLSIKVDKKQKNRFLKVIVWEIHSRILGKGRFKKAREKLENFNLSQNRNLNINVLI
jgi:hypothetical protein